MVISTILIFLALLLVLVLVHELGHFFMAKLAGCRVEEFGFGFPPRLLKKTYGETTYSLNLLPLGGFVRIEGEDMADAMPSPTNFASKPALWRIGILIAGVAMNIILAAFLLTIQSVIGSPVLVDSVEHAATLSNLQTYIAGVAPGSPAQEAGLKELDRIISIDNHTQPTVDVIKQVAHDKAGQEISLIVDRQGQKQTLTLIPRVDPPPGEGALGVSLTSTGLQKTPLWKAPWVGIQKTLAMIVAIVTQFVTIIGKLISQGTVGETLTGPVGIALYTREAATMGFSYLLEFAALVSLNLAIINILPIPALDGGRVLFVLLEKITGGRTLSMKIEKVAHAIGFLLLITLMILITFRDIQSYF